MATIGKTTSPWCNALIFGFLAACISTAGAQEAPSGEGRDAARYGAEDSLAQRYAQADLVAQVQVTGIHRDIDNALSEPGMVAISGYVYSGVSRRLWKGRANRLIAFRVALESCDRKLKKGEHYLIFARADSYGRLQLHSCEAAVAEPDAAPLLARLEQFDKQG